MIAHEEKRVTTFHFVELQAREYCLDFYSRVFWAYNLLFVTSYGSGIERQTKMPEHIFCKQKAVKKKHDVDYVASTSREKVHDDLRSERIPRLRYRVVPWRDV